MQSVLGGCGVPDDFQMIQWCSVTSEDAFYFPVIITVDNLFVRRVGRVSQELFCCYSFS